MAEERKGYTHAGSGKSQARHLFGVMVYAIMAAFVIAAWKGQQPNASWAAIIGALTAPLGGAWIFGKVIGRGKDAPQQAPGAGEAPRKDGEA